MIVVHLLGGLGNQLFQYSLGRKLSIIKNTTLKLNIRDFSTFYKLHKYSLNHFNIKEEFATNDEINYLISNTSPLFFEPNDLTFNENVFNIPENYYLSGYWQCEKYFKDIESILMKDFTIKNEISGKNKEISNLILNTISISMHIRRTDFVTNKQVNQLLGTCSIEYYLKSMDIMAKKFNDPYFFIFSDDLKWVKKNIPIKYSYTYVDHNNADTNYEDLRLMSLCNHNITANSSFSWWGAYLNKNKEKIVISPKVWWGGSVFNDKDIVPNTWLRV